MRVRGKKEEIGSSSETRYCVHVYAGAPSRLISRTVLAPANTREPLLKREEAFFPFCNRPFSTISGVDFSYGNQTLSPSKY